MCVCVRMRVRVIMSLKSALSVPAELQNLGIKPSIQWVRVDDHKSNEHTNICRSAVYSDIIRLSVYIQPRVGSSQLLFTDVRELLAGHMTIQTR